MTFAAADVLHALRAAGHSVRRQGDRIMIAPAPEHPDDVAAIKATRDGILNLLASEDAYAAMMQEPEPSDPFGRDARNAYTPSEWLERQDALTHWIEHNARIDARPQEVARRRQAKRVAVATTDTEELHQ